jgi:hypothetical protein
MALGGILKAFGQGLGQTSNALVLDQQLKEKKEEMKQKEKRAEFLEIQLGAKKTLAGAQKTESLFRDASKFETQAERNQYLKLPKQQKRLQEISGLNGRDPEEIMMEVTNKTLFFKNRQTDMASGLRSFAKTSAIQESAPEFAENLNQAATRIENPNLSPEEFDTILKDTEGLLGQLKDYDRQFLKGQGISAATAANAFKRVAPGTHGSQKIFIKGEGEVDVVPRKDIQQFQVRSSDTKVVRDTIAQNMGVSKIKREFPKEGDDFGFVTGLLEPKINKKIQDGVPAATAAQEEFANFKAEVERADEAIDSLVKSLQAESEKGDPIAKEQLNQLRKEMKTLVPSKMKLQDKIELYRELGGGRTPD